MSHHIFGAAILLGIQLGVSGQSFAAASAEETACVRLKSAVAARGHRLDDLYCIPYDDTKEI